MKLKKGLMQIYTGCGKGKTTAALGLALRAAGAGLRVYILQFLKGRRYGELESFKHIKGVKIEQVGKKCFIKKKPTKADIECARQGLRKAKKLMLSGKYDVLILDEGNIALKLGLFGIRDIMELINKKPPSLELVLTGRYCPRELFRYADVVTDMREIKHPYKRGTKARRGIEF